MSPSPPFFVRSQNIISRLRQEIIAELDAAFHDEREQNAALERRLRQALEDAKELAQTRVVPPKN
jgi:hypothetical protein